MKRIVLVFLSWCFFNVSFGQQTVTIDFSNPSGPVLPTTRLKRGEYYKIIISGINKNLYKISLSSTDSVSSKPQQTPTFGTGASDLDALSKLIAGLSPLSTSVSALPSAGGFKSQISHSDIMVEDFPFSARTNVKSTIRDRMEKEKRALISSKDKLDAIAAAIDDLKLDVYKVRLNALRVENTSTSFDYAKALSSVESIRARIAALQKDIVTSKSSYEDFSKKNKDDIEKKPEYAEADKGIKELFEKFSSSVAEMQNSVTADKANELLSSLVLIENNKSNTYTSLPIQFMGEQAKIQLSIVPRNESFNLQSYSTQLIFPTELKHYTVVGVSFYGTTLYDKAYSSIKTKVNDTTSVYNFKEEDVTKGGIGIAALLRHGTKINNDNDVGVHGAIGAGVSISNKIKPRLLFGGGFSFGAKHMVAVDIGGIVGYVDRLSNSVDLSTTYFEKPESVTVSKLKVGGFLSVGYIYQF